MKIMIKIEKKSLRKLFFILLTFVSISAFAQKSTIFNDSTSITKEITSKYFNAYFNLDFDTMKSIMHDKISFHDPTAKFLFGGKKVMGKIDVYDNFKKSYAAIIEMKQKTIRTIFSSNTGVFELNLVYKFNNGPDQIITIEMPLIVILTVEDGKVIEHRDYADYNYFMEQYNNQLKK
tara:strand:+ start:71 stop:601 length:531 start_codon:yes stop_codon:yes gene_type:complete